MVFWSKLGPLSLMVFDRIEWSERNKSIGEALAPASRLPKWVVDWRKSSWVVDSRGWLVNSWVAIPYKPLFGPDSFSPYFSLKTTPNLSV